MNHLNLILLFALISIITGCTDTDQIETDIEGQFECHMKLSSADKSIREENMYRSEYVTKTKNSISLSQKSPQKPSLKTSISNKVMDQKINLNSFSQELSLKDAISEIKNAAHGQINIAVLWRDLARVGIYDDSIVSIDPIGNIKLKTALKLILSSVSDGYGIIDYKLSNGVIIIASDDTLARFGQKAQVYNITDLSQLPAEYRATSLNNSTTSNR